MAIDCKRLSLQRINDFCMVMKNFNDSTIIFKRGNVKLYLCEIVLL